MTLQVKLYFEETEIGYNFNGDEYEKGKWYSDDIVVCPKEVKNAKRGWKLGSLVEGEAFEFLKLKYSEFRCIDLYEPQSGISKRVIKAEIYSL